LAKVESSVTDAATAGHNAWMLTSSALVLFMTAPGLAMFYGGLVRKKNVLGVMMQCLFLLGLLTVVWGLYGYSLAFRGAAPHGRSHRSRSRRHCLFAYHQHRRLLADEQRPAPTQDRNGRRRGKGQRPGNAHGRGHPASDAHALSRHVLQHHAGPHLRRLRRTH